MTKEQVIEKLAVVLGEWAWRDSFYGEYVTEQDRESCRKQARSFFKANPELVLKIKERVEGEAADFFVTKYIPIEEA